jgi:hypothetical protein
MLYTISYTELICYDSINNLLTNLRITIISVGKVVLSEKAVWDGRPLLNHG